MSTSTLNSNSFDLQEWFDGTVGIVGIDAFQELEPKLTRRIHKELLERLICGEEGFAWAAEPTNRNFAKAVDRHFAEQYNKLRETLPEKLDSISSDVERNQDEWRAGALCKDPDRRENASTTKLSAKVVATCVSCPVFDLCLQFPSTTHVRAGLTPASQRRRLAPAGEYYERLSNLDQKNDPHLYSLPHSLAEIVSKGLDEKYHGLVSLLLYSASREVAIESGYSNEEIDVCVRAINKYNAEKAYNDRMRFIHWLDTGGSSMRVIPNEVPQPDNVILSNLGNIIRGNPLDMDRVRRAYAQLNTSERRAFCVCITAFRKTDMTDEEGSAIKNFLEAYRSI